MQERAIMQSACEHYREAPTKKLLMELNSDYYDGKPMGYSRLQGEDARLVAGARIAAGSYVPAMRPEVLSFYRP